MTREEAAANLLQYLKEKEKPGSVWATSLDMAISALREQEERSKGCEYCKEYADLHEHCLKDQNIGKIFDTCIQETNQGWHIELPSGLDIGIRFCPMCGRRLEEV